jgi:hypothetical protein
MDAAGIVATALSVPGFPARVTSIHVDADIDQISRTATITGVRGGPLQVGQNTLNVTLKPTGKPPVTVPVTFTVPSGLALDAGVAVEAGSGYFGGEDGEAPSAESLADIVDWINDVPTNDQIVVSLPDSNGNPVVVGRTSTDYYLEGAQYPSAVAGSLVAEAPAVLIGDPVNLLAMPSGLAAGTPITLSERVPGSPDWQTVATEPVEVTSDGMAAALFSVSPTANTTYRASWPGDDDWLGWAAEAEVTVSPPLSLQGSRRGNAWQVDVASDPQAAGVSVVLQTKREGAWAPVASGVLSAEGTASLQWRTGPQSARVRAVTDPTPRLAAGSSGPLTLTSTSLVVNPDAKPRPAGNVTFGLRNPSGAPITGATFRVQRKAGDGWEQAARATLRKSSRLWLANGDYRVTVPQQKGVPAQARQSFTVSSATIVIRSVTGGRGRARVVALPPIPLRFTVQKQQAGQWLPVAGARRMAPPKMSWSGRLKPGRYRFAFPQQNGFQAVVSDSVRVR